MWFLVQFLYLWQDLMLISTLSDFTTCFLFVKETEYSICQEGLSCMDVVSMQYLTDYKIADYHILSI